MDQTLLEDIKKLILALLAEKDVELVELIIGRERGKSILRFLVDRSGGITLDECARLNKEIGEFLDQNNLIQESYVLEVSSPGLDRPLVSTRDFERLRGQLVKIVLHKPINRQNVWIGVVDKIDERKVTIRTENEQRLQIARENIARAKLEIKIG